MIMIMVVLASLLYVHQHVKIIALDYVLRTNQIEVAQLLDQNASLVYNIEQLENPRYLEEKLNSEKTVFAMPEKGHVVKLAQGKEELPKIVKAKKARKGIFDFLVPEALAQNKPSK